MSCAPACPRCAPASTACASRFRPSTPPRCPPRQPGLRQQIQALDAQLADREIYLQLADSLEDFLTDLRTKAATATVPERQRVLRLLVQDVLVGPDKITVRHRIPIRHSPTDSSPETDAED